MRTLPGKIDKDILKKRIRIYLSVLSLGIVYGIWVRYTGIGIPCPFRMLTGWLCPGCGITTLFMRLLSGDIRGSFEANPFILLTSPVLITILAVNEYFILTPSCKRPRIKKLLDILCVIYVIALLAFGVVRNIV